MNAPLQGLSGGNRSIRVHHPRLPSSIARISMSSGRSALLRRQGRGGLPLRGSKTLREPRRQSGPVVAPGPQPCLGGWWLVASPLIASGRSATALLNRCRLTGSAAGRLATG